MKSAAGIDYVDVSPGRNAGDAVDDRELPTPAPVSPSSPSPDASLDTTGTEGTEGSETATASTDFEAVAEAPVLVSGDVHAVMLGLWASGLRCVIVYAVAPAVGAAGPLAVGTALVIQVAGAAVSLSGAHSLWTRRCRGRCVYALITALTCLCTLAALLAPTGF
ncbi:hypothetical protein [Actinomyces viscosus]|uniref:hypothetical protein n=1 Tax=Actinomyces viscosus TaxID=1656 RepID=UPI0028E4CC85|nr:hypothetical protein [Actinomyces viscosus]